MTFRATALALALMIPTGAASAQEWGGFYGGLSLSNLRGDWQHTYDGKLFNDGAYSSDTGLGFFAGYNLQSGKLVYGAELAMSAPSGFCFEEYPEECSKEILDLKARVGFAAGSALIYGVAGVSRADYETPDETTSLEGTAYGFGVDYRLSENYFVGGEILRRDTDYVDGSYMTEHQINSVSLRLGMRF